MVEQSPAATSAAQANSAAAAMGKKAATADVVEAASLVIGRNHLPWLQFACGVLNALLKAFLLGAFPQNFWLYPTVQFPILMSLLVPRSAKKNKLLYFAEFCWVINVVGWLYLCYEAAETLGWSPVHLDSETRLEATMMFFGNANGPLALSVRCV